MPRISMIDRKKVLKDMIFLRLGQLLVNEMYKKGRFKIPIHLALGHEAIAVAVEQILTDEDQLALSHRNIHYNMVREKRVELEIDEYLLKPTGLAGGKLGSMNLLNPNKNIIYTSNILGNNLPVSCGLSLAQKMNRRGTVFVITGDGAMEEGSFYESLLFMKSFQLSNIVIIENNEWSLATQIHERRSAIDVSQLVAGLGIEYVCLEGNNVFDYVETLKNVRSKSIDKQVPICVEVKLSSLGDWCLEKEGYPEGKFINYHAGSAPTVDIKNSLVIEQSNKDPLYLLLKQFTQAEIDEVVNEFYSNLTEKLRDEIH
jgi:TPP-dependent pyruvate/acetoin dehydrogenase alpha subunit